MRWGGVGGVGWETVSKVASPMQIYFLHVVDLHGSIKRIKLVQDEEQLHNDSS